MRQDPGSLVVKHLARVSWPTRSRPRAPTRWTRPARRVIAADDQIPALASVLAAAGVPHAVLEGAATGGVITLVPVTLAKGLEFDQVIVYEPAQIAAAERAACTASTWR